jgi:hypothetical protein
VRSSDSEGIAQKDPHTPLLDMNTDLDKQGILDRYRSGALLDAIFDNFGSAFQEEAVISKCVEMHNLGEINLLALIEAPTFDSIDVQRFFAGQNFYCKVIPRLDATPHDMMTCVKALAEKGGQDLAANWPNGFTEWCSADLSRATAIIESSDADDPLAREFLSFALTAGNAVQHAIRIADAYRDDRRVRAITALGRMNYTGDLDSARIALDALKRAIDDQVDDILYANTLSSALGIADKAGPVALDTAAEIVKAVCATPGPQTQYCCACVISMNRSAINTTMLSYLFGALASTPPELKGTLKALDTGCANYLIRPSPMRPSPLLRNS